jgi:Ala-tRNA(Pro) deacylase
MSIASHVQDHLNHKGVYYELLAHPYSLSSLESARLARVPAEQVAKGVLTHDGQNYLLCVIPSNHRLSLPWLNRLQNGNFSLVSEHRLGEFFDDCEPGAVPALGQVYGLHVLWDSELAECADLYFESGDHENLVHVSRGAFMELMGGHEHATISYAET